MAAGALGVVAGPAGPAHACSCSAAAEEDLFARADVVFRGDVTQFQPSQSSEPLTWRFAVSEVFKGEAAASQEVVSEATSCALELRRGEYFVFADLEAFGGQVADGRLHANLCGGTRSVDRGPLLATAAVSVAGSAPAPSPATGGSDGSGLIVGALVTVGLVLAVALVGLDRRIRRREA
ncbi:MAG TPA: hypothetical protein VF244_07090 [Acidimicrobiales bacterium]